MQVQDDRRWMSRELRGRGYQGRGEKKKQINLNKKEKKNQKMVNLQQWFIDRSKYKKQESRNKKKSNTCNRGTNMYTFILCMTL